MLKQISTTAAPSAIGPYSQGVQAGDFIYFSGQIPLSSETGEIVGTTIEEQTAQIMKNIEGLLTSQQLTFANVVKTTCFLIDMADFAAFNNIYAEYFINKPARSCVAVRELPKSVLCEVEVIAYVSPK